MIARPAWFSATYYMYNKLTQTQAIEGMADYSYANLLDAIMSFSRDGTLEDATWNHYEQYGSKEGMPLRNTLGALVISPQVYCESKLAQLKSIGFPNSDTMTWEDVLEIITNAGMTLYGHYMGHGAAEGLTINANFNTGKYFAAKLEYVKTHTAQFPELAHLTTVAALAEFYTLNGVDPYQNWLDYGEAEGISAAMVTPSTGGEPGTDPTEGEAFYLKPLGWWGSVAMGDLGYHYADNMTGTDGDDTFIAYIYGDQNSLNTGDQINGKGGTDTLLADVTGIAFLGDNGSGGGYVSALTPILTDVEILKFRVQETGSPTDGGDNNPKARIDAERIAGAKQFWSSNSRDDLKIEDVRINSNLITVGMQNTDPGNVDYELYFDPQHLKADDATTSGTLILKLIDTEGALGGNPLLDNPYNKIYVHFDGELLEIEFAKVFGEGDTETMYEKLRAEIQTAVTAMDLGFTVTLGNTFSMVDSNSGKTVIGREILMSGEGTFTVDKLEGDGWGTVGAMPPDTSVAATMKPQGSVDCPLIKTNVALDNVGRVQWDDAYPACLPDDSIYGSNAGDLIIGSMATRGGVERFDVTVDRGSWLKSLASTNNTLRMITVAAKDWDGDGWANSKEDPNAGQLFIGAHSNATAANDQTSWQNAARLLTAAKNTSGIWDVKYFEASDYAGDISIAAEFTTEAYDKYLKEVDGLRTVYSSYAPSGDFVYNFGSGDDTLNMKVDSSLLADRDFILNMNMGAGNDLVNYVTEFKTGNQAVDQTRLKNVTISTGAGNDTVWAWGKNNDSSPSTTNEFNMEDGSLIHVRDQLRRPYDGASGYLKVDAGSGDDAVYAAQSSNANAVWVINANTLAGSAGDPLRINFGSNGQAQPLSNNVASTNDYVITHITSAGTGPNGDLHPAEKTYTLYGRVSFLGIEVEFTVGTYTIGIDKKAYTVKADELNKAIITAINKDPQLGKLLSAFDGAGNSLLVQSLIDGKFVEGNGHFNTAGEFVMTDGDFSIGFYDVTGAGTSSVYSYADSNATMIGDIVDQAHAVASGNAGEAYRELTVLNMDATGFIANQHGTIYTLTIGSTELTYTQQATDNDWTDIVNGLNAQIGGYTLSTPYQFDSLGNLVLDANGDPMALNPGRVIITRNTTDYVHIDLVTGYDTAKDPKVTYTVEHAGSSTGTLTFAVSTDWAPTAGAAGTQYVLTIGGVNISATGTSWTALVTNLDAAANAVATSGLIPGLNDPDNIKVSSATAGVVTVEIKEMSTTYNPNVEYSTRTVDNTTTTGTYETTIDFTGSYADGNVATYTITVDPDGTGSAPAVTLTGAQTTSDTWADVVSSFVGTVPGYTVAAGAVDGELIIRSTDTAIPTATDPATLLTVDTANTNVSTTVSVTPGAVAFANPGLTTGYYQYSSQSTVWSTTNRVAAGATYTITINNAGGSTDTITTGPAGGTETWDQVIALLQTATTDYKVESAGSDGLLKITANNAAASAFTLATFIETGGATNYLGGITPPPAPACLDKVMTTVTFSSYADGETETYTVEIGGTVYTYTQLDTDNWAGVVAGLGAVPDYVLAAGATDGVLTVTTDGPVEIKTGTTPSASNPVTGATCTDTVGIVAADVVSDFSTLSGETTFNVTGWSFTEGEYGKTYSITIAGEMLSTTQYAGNKWADIVENLKSDPDYADLLAANYTIAAGDDGELVITYTGLTSFNPVITLNHSSTDPNVTRLVPITIGDFSDFKSTSATSIQVSGFNTIDVKAGDKYEITIDPDGAGATGSGTLSYTVQNDGESWTEIVNNLRSYIVNDPNLKDNVLLWGTTTPGTLYVQKDPGSALTENPVVESIGGNKVGVNPAATFVNYVQTEYAQNGAIGTDSHYYGLTEVYGGDGADVIVTGYADAKVYAGSGNDTIVVGSKTYNEIWGGTGADTIVLGSRTEWDPIKNEWVDQANNGNNLPGTNKAFDAVHQAKGDSGVIASSAIVEVSGGTDYVATGTFDVIHNFDKGAATGSDVTLSDRLYLDDYITTGTYANLTNPELKVSGQMSSLLNLKNAITTDSAANDNKVMWVNGVYDEYNQKFTISSTSSNRDMLLVYDADPTKSDTNSSAQTWEAVILTGVGGGSVHVTDNKTLDADNIDFITIS